MKSSKFVSLLTLLLLVPYANGQEFFVDNFDDEDLTDGSPVSWSPLEGIDASSGDMTLTSGSNMTVGSGAGILFDDSVITTRFRILDDFRQFGQFSRLTNVENAYYSEFHANGRIALWTGLTLVEQFQADIDGTSNDIWMQMASVGDTFSLKVWEEGSDEPLEPQVSMVDSSFSSGDAGLWFDPGPSRPRSSTAVVRSFSVTSPADLDINGELDAHDIDLLAAEMRREERNQRFDVNRSSSVDLEDHSHMIQTVLETWHGDANLDGEFNSGDLVSVFSAGEYEDDLPLNSGWAEGDWNGDGEFDSSDLVTAFQDGGYEGGPRLQVNFVPEPSGLEFVVAGLLGLLGTRRRCSHHHSWWQHV